MGGRSAWRRATSCRSRGPTSTRTGDARPRTRPAPRTLVAGCPARAPFAASTPTAPTQPPAQVVPRPSAMQPPVRRCVPPGARVRRLCALRTYSPPSICPQRAYSGRVSPAPYAHASGRVRRYQRAPSTSPCRPRRGPGSWPVPTSAGSRQRQPAPSRSSRHGLPRGSRSRRRRRPPTSDRRPSRRRPACR